MAWRFKASKYKNAAPIVPKPEACVRDISVGSYQTHGNNIASSAAFMAFNVDHNGSHLAVLPIDDCGRKSKTMPLLHGHTDTITDMDFSPFHDGLLATGSQDCLVKVWNIPEKGLEESLSTPECTFSHRQRRVETVRFHPVADGLLTTSSFTTLVLWDIFSEKELFTNNDHGDIIQAISWKRDGKLLVTSCKDKLLRVIDPRAGSQPVVNSTSSHQSIKDSRVVWLGETNRVLSTGFDSARQREVYIRDVRKFNETEKTLTLDSSTGILIPLYDPDTGMLFLAGKGDTTISYLEVTDKEPHLVEGIRHSGEQTKGACLVPKRALNVMQAEVNRLLQLTSSSVIPIMYQVPRKSYRDFHGDLFPDTNGSESSVTPSQWMEGIDSPVVKISLDPNNKHLAQVHRGTLAQMRKKMEENCVNLPPKPVTASQKVIRNNIISAKTVFEKDNNETNEQKNKKKSNEFPKKTDLVKEENNLNSNKLIQNGGSVGAGDNVTPPKPLPRASRTSSLSEDDSIPKPVARPRTNSVINAVTPEPSQTIADNMLESDTIVPLSQQTGQFVSQPLPAQQPVSFTTSKHITGAYKPRLGPKPFTPPKLGAGDSLEGSQLDRVFCVPVAPGMEQPISSPVNVQPTTPIASVNGTNDLLHSSEHSPESPITAGITGIKIDDDNMINGTEKVMNNEQGPLTPSSIGQEFVAQDNDPTDLAGGGDEIEGNRSSIAERRRMYESRSLSVQETASPAPTPTPLRRRDSLKSTKSSTVKEEDNVSNTQGMRPTTQLTTATAVPKRTSTVFGRVSKFRHLKGTPAHKSMHIENVRNVSRQISGECDGFHANKDRVAVPLSGPGGKIAIFELSKPGKLPDGVIPTLVQGTNVMDFAWDPFDTHRLAVACDDGTIKLWKIPEGGLTEPTNSPEKVLLGHQEKIYFIKFHPLASDVLASGSYDMTVRVWNLVTGEEKLKIEGHTDQMFSLAWSPCGRMFATACKDTVLRVYDPRKSDNPVAEGKGPIGSRGARVVWALEGSSIVVTGFDKVSERQIMVFRREDMNTPLGTVGLDVSPAILIPFYDEDSSTLFLTGRGDSTIYAFEVCCEPPYLCPLSHHRCPSLHQGLSFQNKNCCDVSTVEFARALRLTNTTIEPLSFTVPRIKSDLFQDDLFPPTKVTWEPTLTAEEWFSGMNRMPSRISLKPENMGNLSDAQSNTPTNPAQSPAAASKPVPAFPKPSWNSDSSTKQKQDEIQRLISSRVEVNMKLEQDKMEGVDEREWDE
ncbi:coronin [Lycorma delicatula]|uniref:coronin n=1 Tax=Lycorma delicatula TaxID=130591 RepID=UPI003F512EA4